MHARTILNLVIRNQVVPTGYHLIKYINEFVTPNDMADIRNRILVVCSANKGRSPALAAQLKEQLRLQGITDVEIDSAGVNVDKIKQLQREGKVGANATIKRVMTRTGTPQIGEHKAKPVTAKLAARATVILALDGEVRETLLKMFPRESHKIHTARGFVSGKETEHARRMQDVEDPISPWGKSAGKEYRGKAAKESPKAFYLMTNEARRLAVGALSRIRGRPRR